MEIADSVLSRFLRYVKIDTQSNPDSVSTPSTKKQFKLARLLEQELRDMGLADVYLDDCCYLYARVPSNLPPESIVPGIGFIAHLDTSPEVSGRGVKPRIETGENGEKIVRSDGTTLLGADDKAGVAEIMTAAEYLILHPEIPRGDIYIAFTPDEELGRGADLFDLDRFAAAWAYTVDGGEAGEISAENFYAAEAEIIIRGSNCHPGYAKGVMKNSLKAAAAIVQETTNRFPSPEQTEGREGYVHINKVMASVEMSFADFVIRSFDPAEFELFKEGLTHLANDFRAQLGSGYEVELDIQDSYRNMSEVLSQHPRICRIAMEAMRAEGITPKIEATRGGTDGARLSFMGLPCPNIFAGGINFHSREEYVPVRSLFLAAKCIINIAKLTAEEFKG